MANKKKRRGVPPPKDETKEQRFVRVCTPRVAKAVKAINLIAHCSGAFYGYTPQQVEQIDRALTKAFSNTMNAFVEKKAETAGFKFTSE